MAMSIFRHLRRSRTCELRFGKQCEGLRDNRLSSVVKRCYSVAPQSVPREQNTSLLEEKASINPLDYDDYFNVKTSINPLDYDDYFNVKSLVNLNELFDARVHLGHHEGCLNPLNRQWIHGLRATQHVIDLNQTVECLQRALNVLSHIVYKRGVVCFVSTSPRYDYLIQKTARTSGEYFITREWEMGTFNNIYYNLKTDRLPDLIIGFQLSRFEKSREIVLEAAMCNIPVIGIVDTDVDPCMITYPVPANDDTMCSVEKLCSIFKQAILNAKERLEHDNSLLVENNYVPK